MRSNLSQLRCHTLRSHSPRTNLGVRKTLSLANQSLGVMMTYPTLVRDTTFMVLSRTPALLPSRRRATYLDISASLEQRKSSRPEGQGGNRPSKRVIYIPPSPQCWRGASQPPLPMRLQPLERSDRQSRPERSKRTTTSAVTTRSSAELRSMKLTRRMGPGLSSSLCRLASSLCRPNGSTSTNSIPTAT
jgi:hypothetical protein